MVRNSTKVLFASVVLGVMNQACALSGGQREGIPTAPIRVTLAPSSDLTLPAKPSMPGRIDTDYVPAPQAVDGVELPPAPGRSSSLDRYPPLRLVAAEESTGPSGKSRSRDVPMPINGSVTVSPLADPQSTRVTVRTLPIKPLDPATGAQSAARTTAEPIEAPRAERPADVAERRSADTQPAAVNVATRDSAGFPMQVPVAAAPAEANAMATEKARAKSAGKPGFGNLWERIRAGFSIPNLESPLVTRHEEWYQNRPDYVQRIVERGRRYMHFIVEEVEKRGMPLEIALLPMIESAYNPTAYSKAHASGIWQFIPATGRTYGLQQNWWYDGRRDVTAATRAALDYLEKLHVLFGDWQLALAAYNWGEGAVTRAIERNQRKGLPTDYESLKMPAETRNYLPKLQAVKNIITEPERFGMPLEEVPNEPYFIRVAAPGSIDFKRAAQLAETPLEEFRSLNPAHNRPVIGPSTDGSLLVPAEKAEVFNANLTKALDSTLVSWQTYRLEKNEKLETIAARFGTTAANLRQVNGIGPRNKLKVGSTLLVPLSARDAQKLEVAALDTTDFHAPEAAPEADAYRARAGDTLYSIAARNGVSVQQLMDWNHLRSPKVHAGQRIALKAGTAASAPPQKHASRARASERVSVARSGARVDRIAQRDSGRIRPATRSLVVKTSCCGTTTPRRQQLARR